MHFYTFWMRPYLDKDSNLSTTSPIAILLTHFTYWLFLYLGYLLSLVNTFATAYWHHFVEILQPNSIIEKEKDLVRLHFVPSLSDELWLTHKKKIKIVAKIRSSKRECSRGWPVRPDRKFRCRKIPELLGTKIRRTYLSVEIRFEQAMLKSFWLDNLKDIAYKYFTISI